MGKGLKNIRLNIFTFIEIIFAFAVITLAIAINLGYVYQIKTRTTKIESKEFLYSLNAFTFLAVLVTALGIMGIQLIQIYRRTNEIGLRKAVGAKDIDIILLILKSTLLLILIPALIGVVSGIALSIVIPFHEIGLQARTDYLLILGSIIALFVFTIITGILPSIKALVLNPSEIFRKHVITKREKHNKRYNIAFFVIATMIIIAGSYINYAIEKEYKEDILNTAGAPPSTSQAVPSFMFEDSKGNIIFSEELMGNSYCLLIWETSCPVGKVVLAEVNKLMLDGYINNSELCIISLDKSYDKVKDFLVMNNIAINSFVDNEKSTKWAFNANILPAVYIVDNNGIISARALGWSEGIKEYLMKNLSILN